MISHATSQGTQIQTHCLDVFSNPMISHATSQETRGRLTVWMCFQVLCNFSGNTETDSPTGCVFRSHDQSSNFSGNTETDSPTGCVFRSHDQSCNFSGNMETDSPPACVFRSPEHSKKKGISIYLLDDNQHLSLALCHFLTVLPWGCSCICLSTSSKFIFTYILLWIVG